MRFPVKKNRLTARPYKEKTLGNDCQKSFRGNRDMYILGNVRQSGLVNYQSGKCETPVSDKKYNISLTRTSDTYK